jgi:hypothetical protein
MFRNAVAPATRGRAGWMVVGLMIVMLSGSAVRAQQPPAQPAQQPAQPAQQAQAQKSPYVFAGDAAAILNFVKADKTGDFEMVVGKLKEALAKSDKPERKQQAASWKIYKAAEGGPGGAVIYVSTMEPAVKGADYSVALILSEAFPTEVQALYKTYSECFGQPAQNILNLTLVNDLSK